MENEDLIIRKPFPDDNRVIEVFITEKGKNILYELKTTANEIYKQAFDGINEADAIKFTTILMKMRENLTD